MVLREMHPESTIRRRAALHARVSHPNIARYFGLIRHEREVIDDGERELRTTWYLVTEFLRGGSLADRIRAGPIPWHTARRLLLSIARGLACIHALGIQHRDLKPEIVCLEHEGHDAEPKIVDVGSFFDETRHNPVSAAVVGTGTHMYMSPERLRGEFGTPDDVWALGLLFAEMVQGQRISSIFQSTMFPGHRPETDIAWLVARCGGDDLLRRMLAHNPRDRPTAAAIVSALESNETPVPVLSHGTPFPGMANERARFVQRLGDPAAGISHRNRPVLLGVAAGASFAQRVPGRPAAATARRCSSSHGPGFMQRSARTGSIVAESSAGGATLLHIACEEGRVDLARVCLQHGTDVNRETYMSETPLWIACYKGKSRCAHLLLSRGANVDADNHYGETPLYIACQEGHLDCTRVLLCHNARVNTWRDDGKTPLFVACEKGHFDCTQLLLAFGAHMDKADNSQGATPLFIACANGRRDCVQILLDRGADMETANDDGVTPLFIACQLKHVDCVQLLLERGADMEKPNENGATPLFVACQEGHVECARILLERGALIDSAIPDGTTPFGIAHELGHHGCVHLLNAYGANGGWEPSDDGDDDEVVHVHVDDSEPPRKRFRTGETQCHL